MHWKMLQLHLLFVKIYVKESLTKLVPTRSLAQIAFLDLSPEGNADTGFGGVYHLWILHKTYRQGRDCLATSQSGQEYVPPSVICESHGAHGNSHAKPWPVMKCRGQE